jgi:AraC-like DNA-binding protein
MKRCGDRPIARRGLFPGLFPSLLLVVLLAGWNLDFRQLDPGAYAITASIVSSRRVMVMRVRSECGFHQTGGPPPGLLTFGLPVNGMKDWYGRPYVSGSILPFNHSSGVDGVSRPGFEAFTISIAEDFLREISASHQLPLPDHVSLPKAGASISNSRSARNLRQAMDKLTNDDEAWLDADQEATLVVDLLMAALVDFPIEDQSSPAVRAHAVSAALDFIEAHQHEAVSVGKICSQIGVSWRTLNRAFSERFGIGPKAYMQRLRLAGVRNELVMGSGKTVIADVANDWGFWHRGQFARDYRIHFGERPSESLSRSGS